MGKRQQGQTGARRGRKGTDVAPIAQHGITAFTPGQPLPPGPGIVAADGTPRQFTFPAGYNIAQRPRATELTPFETLRQFAALYEGVQLCERVYLDILGRLEARVVRRGGDGRAADDALGRAIALAGVPRRHARSAGLAGGGDARSAGD